MAAAAMTPRELLTAVSPFTLPGVIFIFGFPPRVLELAL
jgi:hypothetical protein